MPRLINPVDWSLAAIRVGEQGQPREAPIVSLRNSSGHQLHVHPINDRLVRVVHTQPRRSGDTILRNHINPERGVDGIAWEPAGGGWEVIQPSPTSQKLSLKGSLVTIDVDFSHSVQLSWTWNQSPQDPFLRDFKKAYEYDARSGRVFHYVCREGYMPRSEHDGSADETHPAHPGVEELVYGLGEAKGRMMKSGKRYYIDGRDSLGADPEETDPLYKLCPYYAVLNKRTRMAYGLYYSYLGPSIFDLGGEHDFSTGNFRSYSAENGPLDYYVLLGEDPERPTAKPTLPSIVTQLAKLVTPATRGPAGDQRRGGWQASPVLPPLSQLGYLASSLTLSERQDAQDAVIDYVRQARQHGFPIDSMHLSSGYCQDAKTGERNYFTWDRQKYHDPARLGRELEEDLECQVIINVKPWLLESHPRYEETARRGAFVRAAPDARRGAIGQAPLDPDRCGTFDTEPARTLHWSVNMGDTGKGSYFDFSSGAGSSAWQGLMRSGVLANHITGFWIDNNEMSTLIDDEETIKGQVAMWSSPVAGDDVEGRAVEERMGGAHGEAGVGAVGRGALTMGMARATLECLTQDRPELRPVIVTRSSVPGMQAFAHGTWSGDNSTTWKSLSWSTKLSLSVSLSFGHGLYGHDIGGFAGAHSPSPELLVRWCQQSMWFTRFTVHSWKKISTTLWMYDDVEGITDLLRAAVSFRYRLIPTLYSLYVTDYHRRGWPVIRPLLWHHSRDGVTLTQDSEFLVGSHLLVAPVTAFGARSVSFHLPRAVGEDEGEPAAWCEIDTGKWHEAIDGEEGGEVTLDSPLSRCPALMRDGGILVLGGKATRNVHDVPSRQHRTALIFPRRIGPSEGAFVLVEDDGRTNEATSHGTFSELRLGFSVLASGDVEVRVQALREAYRGEWKIRFQLPRGDARALIWEAGQGSLRLGPTSEGEEEGCRWLERSVSI